MHEVLESGDDSIFAARRCKCYLLRQSRPIYHAEKVAQSFMLLYYNFMDTDPILSR